MWQHLRTWMNNLPTFDNPIEQQQAPSFQIFMLGLSVAAVFWLAMPLLLAGSALGLIFGLAAPILVLAANIRGIMLLRRGHFGPAANIAIGALTLAVILPLVSWGLETGTGVIFAFSMAISLAGLLTKRHVVLTVGGVSIAAVVFAATAPRILPDIVGFAPLRGDPHVLTATTFVLVAGVLMALFLQFGTSLRNLLSTALARQQELQALRDSLEALVHERTSSLTEALATVQQHEMQLQQTLETLQTSQASVRALSAPIIPVLPGVIVAPLIGEIDSARAALLMDNVLAAVERRATHHVIVDVTGVTFIDTPGTDLLVQTSAAVKLLGAQVCLVGIRPDIAQTLVSVQSSLEAMPIYADLQSAVTDLFFHTHQGPGHLTGSFRGER